MNPDPFAGDWSRSGHVTHGWELALAVGREVMKKKRERSVAGELFLTNLAISFFFFLPLNMILWRLIPRVVVAIL